MRSPLPKVLAPLAGATLLDHVLTGARRLEPDGIHVVVGHGADHVRKRVEDVPGVRFALQAEQLGTGHAVAQALPAIPEDALVLVLLGDNPMIETGTLERLVEAADGGIALLTARLPDPSGYGRIVRREDGIVDRIVEHRDADPATLAINEINSGLLAAPRRHLAEFLGRLDQDNAQGEYYLTDVIALANDGGVTVRAVAAEDPDEVLGANDRWQLAALERAWQRRKAKALCLAGATVADPERIDIRGPLEVTPGTVIDVGAVFEGTNQLGEGVRIGAYCVLTDCELAPGTRVHPHSVLEGVRTTGPCDIGPFARLRPGTELAEGTRVGNFVEMKKARLGPGSKANHLSYVGDAEVGARVNIGAGTITCNYDGVNKHRTEIGDDVFIGSNTELVAPVKVEDGATIGAGSTITKTAPAGALSVGRARQVAIRGWKRPAKKES